MPSRHSPAVDGHTEAFRVKMADRGGFMNMPRWSRLWSGPRFLSFVLGLTIGLALAFPFAAPLIGTKIPEAAATLWGSALGAIAAVAGALLVAKEVQASQRRNAAGLVVKMVRPSLFFLEELCDVYGAPSKRQDYTEIDQEPDVLPPERWGKVRSSVKTLLEEYELLQRKLHRVDAAINGLGPEDLSLVLNLEAALAGMVDSVKVLEKRAMEPGLSVYPGHASWSQRFALLVFLSQLKDLVGALRVSSE